MLRPYQSAAITRGRDAFRAGAKRVVFVAPTGAGKTRLASELVRLSFEKSNHILWLAGRRELVRQAHGAIESLGVDAGILMAWERETPGRVQVASAQTLLKRGTRPPADLLVVDEVHHAAASGLARLIRDYPDAAVIGLTATPERSDGVGLGEIFDRLIVVANPRDLVPEFLVPCDILAPAKQLKVRAIARRPVDAYTDHRPGTSAIVFSPSVKLAGQHACEFQDAGFTAGYVDATMDPDQRDRTIAGFHEGRVQVLCNVNVLTEGTDIPRAETAIMARNFSSPGAWIQAIGRVRRPFPGKQRCTVIDLHGASHVHGHPDEARVYSLEGRGIQRVGPEELIPFCRVCGSPITIGEPCPDCGTGPREAKKVRVTGDDLTKFDEALKRPANSRALALAKLIREGREKGWKPRAAAFKFKGMFGYFPKKVDMVVAEREAEHG